MTMPGEWLMLMALRSYPTSVPTPGEGDFDFVVETTAFTDPPGEGPFDFKVA